MNGKTEIRDYGLDLSISICSNEPQSFCRVGGKEGEGGRGKDFFLFYPVVGGTWENSES